MVAFMTCVERLAFVLWLTASTASSNMPVRTSLIECLADSMSPFAVNFHIQAEVLKCFLLRQVPRLLMGTRSSNLTATLVYNPHPTEYFKPHRVSLHVLIPSVGRRTIFKLLETLEPQLQPQASIGSGQSYSWRMLKSTLRQWWVLKVASGCCVLPATYSQVPG